MIINFNETDLRVAHQNPNVAGTTTSNNEIRPGRPQSSGKSLDISSVVTDNSAYQGHGRTARDVMMDASLENVEVMRDYLTVMSNCVSAEDLGKLQQEGIDPGQVEAKDMVTIVDHIKAALAKGGTHVQGYTDTISDEALAEITGSVVYANELKTSFADKDIPLTASNAEEVKKGFDELSTIKPLSESGVKYLVENELPPSVDNLYKATFSAGNDSMRQGRGYYSTGDVGGYLSKKPENVDIKALMPQVEKIIEDAGLTISEKTIRESEWLIERGIPLTALNLQNYENITGLTLPMSFSEFADHATDAISDGVSVKSYDLSRKISFREEAVGIFDEVSNYGTIHGRRVLEEVRMKMTTEANLKLLRSGFSIDTAPMEDLVKNLREIEKEFAINLTDSEDEIEAVRLKDVFDTTVNLVDSIRVAPISISFVYEQSESLSKVAETAGNLEVEYTKAFDSYETLMTAPRGDFGDSFLKAFGNIDELLTEMGEPITEDNRRAVRILGYNKMEITPENISRISDKDRLLRRTIENMTPGRVLGMIREKLNPTVMSIEELDKYLRDRDTTAEDMLSFSKFLNRLERQNGITEDERAAYIGIYRLINRIERTDFSAVGAIDALGAEFNLSNMLSTIRSRKNRGMDYRVDETFGGIDAVDKGIESITSQIARGFGPDTSLYRDILKEMSDEVADRAFEEARFSELRSTLQTETEVLEQLKNMDTPITAQNIADMKTMMEKPSEFFEKLRGLGYRRNYRVKLDSRESTSESFKEMTGSIKEFLKENVFGNAKRIEEISSERIKESADIYRYSEFLERQSDEENYSIPVNIGGELTAINLKVVHSDKASGVAVSFESGLMGSVAAEFEVENGGLSGICSTSGAGVLRENKELFAEKLSAEDIKLNNISFSENDNLSLTEFGNAVTRGRKENREIISNDKLYKAAKAFIDFVTEVAGEERI